MVRAWGWVAALAAIGFAVFGVAPVASAAELTTTERAWLQAALPVLRYARQQSLPMDVLVQPQPTPGESPLGMAYVGGRCKLVLSMRGNPEAQATLDRIPPDLLGPVIEAIAAHELGHCWRHQSRRWGRLPAGLPGTVPLWLREVTPGEHVTPEQAAMLNEMWRTRREEAYADLVGLAWTQQHHPARYAEVHAWHVRLRAEQAVDSGPHDTRLWVRLAGDPARFAVAATLFDQVEDLWTAGLLAED